jgi:hypothetical protein
MSAAFISTAFQLLLCNQSEVVLVNSVLFRIVTEENISDPDVELKPIIIIFNEC